jgi:hypothetical protein
MSAGVARDFNTLQLEISICGTGTNPLSRAPLCHAPTLLYCARVCIYTTIHTEDFLPLWLFSGKNVNNAGWLLRISITL